VSAKLKPYPEYRDSGVDWLGRVPAHWDVVRNGRLFAERNETDFPDLPILEVSLRTGVRVRDMDGGRKQQMSDRAKYKRAAHKDIAYNIMRMWQGAVGVAPCDGLISPAYVVARPMPGVDARFYTYLFRTTAYMREVDFASRGIVPDRNRLYWQYFKPLLSPAPPHDEQQRIAEYLDAYSAQVQRLVAAKRKLLKAVREQNQLALHELLVRGINPATEVTPSGHDWLGDVPKGWRVAPLKQFAVVNPPLGRSRPPMDSEVVFLPMERIGTNGAADYSERQRVRDVAAGFTAFASGDVVLAKITPCFENGKSAWLDEMPTAVGFGTTELHVLRPTGRLRPELMLQWMRLDLFRQWGEQAMAGAAGQKRVPPRFVRDFVIAASPSSGEQEAMVRQVQRLNRDHEQMRKRILREIDLILEYRDAIIATTVTGQLDVRQVEVAAIEGPDILADLPSDDEDMEDALEQVD
jgi:type I restriction enzyme, S subunit